jgi:hypothetical protein
MELTVFEEARAKTATRAIRIMLAIRQEAADMLVDEFVMLGLRRFCEGNCSDCNAHNDNNSLNKGRKSLPYFLSPSTI